MTLFRGLTTQQQTNKMSADPTGEWSEKNGVLTRRQLITGASAVGALALSGCYGDATYEVDRSIFTFWQDEAIRYERGEVFSMDNPGIWSGKEASHTPSVEVYDNGAAVVARVDHPMDIDHWIEAIYFKDQNGDVFYLQHFGYEDYSGDNGKGAETYIAIPQGVTGVQAYAFCNKHGTWKSELVNRV